MGNCVSIQDQPEDRIYDPVQTWNFHDKSVFAIHGLFGCKKSRDEENIPSDIASLIAGYFKVIDSYILNPAQQQILIHLVCHTFIT